MICARSLSFAAGKRKLVDGIDLDLVPGRFIAVVGPNGAGKSTLLRLLTGELKPTSGQVLIGNRELSSFSADQLARRRAVLAQHTALAFPFTALEVVLLGMTIPGLQVEVGNAHQVAFTMLERLGLEQLAGQSYTTLSGGERQRVHMARALCQLECSGTPPDETILLVDEPTSSLDIGHQLIVLDELVRQKRRGRSVFAVLHDLNLAAAYADEMVLLAGGKVVAAGPPSEVIQDERLSLAFGCQVCTNRLPAGGIPFLLPQACAAAEVCAVARKSAATYS